MELFSNRFGNNDNQQLIKDSAPAQFRRRLIDVIYSTFYQNEDDDEPFSKGFLYRITARDILKRELLTRIIGVRAADIRGRKTQVIFTCLYDNVKKLPWEKVFDIIELILNCTELLTDNYELQQMLDFRQAGYIDDFKIACKNLLVEENMGYSIVGNYVTPIVSKEEAEEITKVTSVIDKYDKTKKHVNRALKQLANRNGVDYSIVADQAIKALEATIRVVIGSRNAYGEALTNHALMKRLFHKSLLDAMRNIYGYASDRIRHAEKPSEEPWEEVTESEGRFLLVCCSALINYVINKSEENCGLID